MRQLLKPVCLEPGVYPVLIHDGCMNQKLLSGFTAALLVSTLGSASSGYADQAKLASQQSGVSVPESRALTTTTQSASTQISQETGSNPRSVPSQSDQPHQAAATTNATANGAFSPDKPFDARTEQKVAADAPATPISTLPSLPLHQADSKQSNLQAQPVSEAVKVGEYQSQQASPAAVVVATIQPHRLQGRNAATLYVRNIPVLTFLGNAAEPTTPSSKTPGAEVKVASTQAGDDSIAIQSPEASRRSTKPAAPITTADAAAREPDTRDPVWRATTTAARLNQLYRDNVDASNIKISWQAERKQYVIAANSSEIVVIDSDTVLPDTVKNASNDVLQATNRIRRQMGGASPLSGIEGEPQRASQVSLGGLNLRVTGYASWYGPGFEGGYTANGEAFRPEGLTAAHRSLPFGTQVRVTNMDNGASVVVRITDRGPFTPDRVIDLSTGAARVIGLIQSGVAPVSLQVLGAAQISSSQHN
jgi:rare lipoprotein A